MSPQAVKVINNNLIKALSSLEEEIGRVKAFVNWENQVEFGKKLAKEKKITSGDIMKSIYESRYPKTTRRS